jgi:hypothetical protein
MRLSTRVLVCAVVAGASVVGCSPRAFLLQGDDKSAEVGYANDVATAMPVAAKHCAGYGRVPELVSQDMDTAYFDCVSK